MYEEKWRDSNAKLPGFTERTVSARYQNESFIFNNCFILIATLQAQY